MKSSEPVLAGVKSAQRIRLQHSQPVGDGSLEAFKDLEWLTVSDSESDYRNEASAGSLV